MNMLHKAATLAAVLFLLTSNSFGQDKASITIKAMLIDDSLNLKPIPRMELHILDPIANDKILHVLTTSFSGEVSIDIEPGLYRLRSVKPITFMETQYIWMQDISVSPNEQLLVELSNDNAIVSGRGAMNTSQSIASDLYERYSGSVVTVDAEAGSGTGFLVDASGLLITNEHVTSESRFFVVEFDDDNRYEAQLVFADQAEDIAVLRVNPAIIQELHILPLAQDSPGNPAVKTGEPVFALGSPLNQQRIITAGIASKIEEGAVISDVMIDHGNSGGPLLNMDGEVIAVNTFGEGRGVSGSVRIWKAYTALDEARNRINSMSMPSAQALLKYPDGTYPADAIRTKIIDKEFKFQDYALKSSKFDILILTPPALAYSQNQERIEAALGRQRRRRHKKVEGEDTFQATQLLANWGEYVGEYKPIVTVHIMPRQKATGGSIFAAALVGSSVIRYRYAGDFDKLILHRGDTTSQHIRMGRSAITNVFQGQQGRMNDAAYGGLVEYLPESFKPPIDRKEEVYFEIINEVKPDKTIKVRIPRDMLERIWSDFSLLRVPATQTLPQEEDPGANRNFAPKR